MSEKEFTVVTLPGGMRLVHRRVNTELIWCGVSVGVGSRDELPHEEGMAHFIEHLVFKGTKTRSNLQLINRIEDVGGELNAYTTKEYTTYYANSLKTDMNRAIDLVLDLALNPVFPENEIEKERNVILDEILSYKDSPSESISDNFDLVLFNEHPLAHNILGSVKTLKKIQRADILNFYHKFYVPANMIFGFVGDVSVDKVVKFIEARLPIHSNMFTGTNRTIPQTALPQHKSEKKKFHQFHCIMGAPTISLTNPQRHIASMITNFLGGPNFSAFLNLLIREKHGLVYQIDSNYITYSDAGVFSIYFASDKADLPKAMDLINKEMNKLYLNGVSENKFNKIKRQYLGQIKMAQESKESQLFSAIKSLMFLNAVETNHMFYEQINAVTCQEFNGVLSNMVNPDGFSSLVFN